MASASLRIQISAAAVILDGFTVPRNGLGKRRYRELVIDQLVARKGDASEIEADDIQAEKMALIEDGRDPAAAEARLRRGAVLSRVAVEYGIELKQTHINRAVMEEARRRSPVEEDVVAFFRSNFRAMAGVHAGVFEKLITDFVIEKALPR